MSGHGCGGGFCCGTPSVFEDLHWVKRSESSKRITTLKDRLVATTVSF